MKLAKPEIFTWVTLKDKGTSTDVTFKPTTSVTAKEYTLTFYNIDKNSPLTNPSTLKKETLKVVVTAKTAPASTAPATPTCTLDAVLDKLMQTELDKDPLKLN